MTILKQLLAILSYKFNPQFPKNINETISIEGLKEDVVVYFDEFGIPHIEAQNALDLARASGFIQSRYRFFQLDMMRRFAQGRLSEILGNQKILMSTTVEFDLAMKGWQLEKRANLKGIPKFDMEVNQAFTAGVNAALKKYKPIEYKILQVDPAPWTENDSVTTGILQAWSLSFNWEQEALRLALALNLGLKASEEIYPNEPLEGDSTMGKVQNKKVKLPPAIVDEVKQFFSEKGYPLKDNSYSSITHSAGELSSIRPSASNAWVISGKHSKNRKPIIANDTHMAHMLPSLMFLMHTKTPDFDTIGVTLPGMPFNVLGHNGYAAWGATSAVADVIDLVIEKEDPQKKDHILYENKSLKIEKLEVEVKYIKNKKMFAEKFIIRQTHNGPSLNDMYPGLLPQNAPLVCIRWNTEKVKNSIGVLYKINQSKTVQELKKHFSQLQSPIQCVTAADSKGNIASFASGSVPVRKYHRGTFPVPGWKKKYDWTSWEKPQKMPSSINPKSGMLAHGNNLLVEPYYTPNAIVQIDSAPDYRMAQILNRIRETKNHTIESTSDIQQDVFLQRAKKVLPHFLSDLKEIKNTTPIQKNAIEELKNWNLKAEIQSSGTTIFFHIYRNAVKKHLGKLVSPQILHFFLKQRYSTNICDLWFFNIKHSIWQNSNKKISNPRTFAVIEAFKEAILHLEKQFGPDIKSWQWGKVHYHQPRHPFGKKSILSFFNLKKIPLGGSLDSVWKAHFNFGEEENPFANVAGPSYRMILDLNDFQNGQFITDTGQSGWPKSPHYGDLYEKWQKGDLVPMHYNWKKIAENSKAKLILKKS